MIICRRYGIGVMEDAVHDGICLCSASQSLMLVCHIVLSYKDRRGVVASLFYEFLYKFCFSLIDFII